MARVARKRRVRKGPAPATKVPAPAGKAPAGKAPARKAPARKIRPRAEALARTASATGVATTHTRSVYAADVGAQSPLSATLAAKVVANDRTIRVGATERLSHGVLRCFVEGDRVCVEVRRGNARVGRRLSIRPAQPPRRGDAFPEAAFSVEVREFIGTPWHEIDAVSVWTVHGLRTSGQAELSG